MDAYRIAFAGPDKIREQLPLMKRIENALREKLCDKERVEFYFDGDGDFDFLASLAAKKLQRECSDCDIRLLLLRAPSERDDGVLGAICAAFCTVAVRERRQANRIDLLIAYAGAPCKRTARAKLRFAEKNGVEIIRLATQES